MASTSQQNTNPISPTDDNLITDLEPGACQESILNPTDSFEEFAAEMSKSLQERTLSVALAHSTISEIQSKLGEDNGTTSPESSDAVKDELVASGSSCNLDELDAEEDEEYVQTCALATKEKNVFILSSAGKPIYSRYGSEDKLAGLCGVIQALVSVVEDHNQDILRSMQTEDCKAVFLVKGPLILVAVAKNDESETHLVLQLTYAFNQIVSVLTLTYLNRIFEQRRNYDLRRLLSGAERLIDNLLTFMDEDPAFLLGAVRCLPLPSAVRETVTGAIVSACSKIKDLVFGILIAGNQLVTLVRMRKYTLHPADIHLVFNLVRSSESFKTAESWTPICLPKFDPTGFLHAHVSYISEDCQACLLLLTVQRDAFFQLSKAKHTIAEKLRKSNCFASINDALSRSKDLPTTNPLKHIGVLEMRHFLYKCKSTAQLFSSHPIPIDKPVRYGQTEPEAGGEDEVRCVGKYRTYCTKMHCTSTPAKLIFKSDSDGTVLTWVTAGFELYVTFDPLVEKNQAITAVDRLLRWIKREEDRLFIMNAPTF